MKLDLRVLAASLALIFISSTTFSQVKKKPSAAPKSKTPAAAVPQKAAVLPVDPDVLIGKLPNGLTYYIRKNTEPKTGHRCSW